MRPWNVLFRRWMHQAVPSAEAVRWWRADWLSHFRQGTRDTALERVRQVLLRSGESVASPFTASDRATQWRQQGAWVLQRDAATLDAGVRRVGREALLAQLACPRARLAVEVYAAPDLAALRALLEAIEGAGDGASLDAALRDSFTVTVLLRAVARWVPSNAAAGRDPAAPVRFRRSDATVAATILEQYAARHAFTEVAVDDDLLVALLLLVTRLSRLPHSTATVLYRWMEHARAVRSRLTLTQYSALLRLRARVLGGLRFPHDIDESVAYLRKHGLRPDAQFANVLLDGVLASPELPVAPRRWHRAHATASMNVVEQTEALRLSREALTAAEQALGYIHRVMRDDWGVDVDTVTLNTVLDRIANDGDAQRAWRCYREWFAQKTPSSEGAGDVSSVGDEWLSSSDPATVGNTALTLRCTLPPNAQTFRALFRSCDPRMRMRVLGPSAAARQTALAAADPLLPRMQREAEQRLGPQWHQAVDAHETLLALVDAHAFAGRTAPLQALLADEPAARPWLAVRALRGLSHNVSSPQGAAGALALHDALVKSRALQFAPADAHLAQSALESVLVACERVGEASRAIDYFLWYGEEAMADQAVPPTERGLQALVLAHARATTALWPALAECLAIAAGDGVPLCPTAMHRLERHYRALGPSAHTAWRQVARLVHLLQAVE